MKSDRRWLNYFRILPDTKVTHSQRFILVKQLIVYLCSGLLHVFISFTSAIYILDVYMDNYVLSEYYEHQKLIGLVCLLLAAKSEDLDERVPSIKDLLKICDMSKDLEVDLRFKSELSKLEIRNAHRQFASMYCKLEFLVFESMQFNTIRPTVVSFLNVFQGILVTEADIKINNDKRSFNELRDAADANLRDFLELVLQSVEFFNVAPSLLAASIVGASRKLLQLENYWNHRLTSWTRYDIDQIRPMMIFLVDKRYESIYRQNDEQMSSDEDTILKDSGFVSIINAASETEETPSTRKKQRLLNRVPITFEPTVFEPSTEAL